MSNQTGFQKGDRVRWHTTNGEVLEGIVYKIRDAGKYCVWCLFGRENAHFTQDGVWNESGEVVLFHAERNPDALLFEAVAQKLGYPNAKYTHTKTPNEIHGELNDPLCQSMQIEWRNDGEDKYTLSVYILPF